MKYTKLPTVGTNREGPKKEKNSHIILSTHRNATDKTNTITDRDHRNRDYTTDLHHLNRTGCKNYSTDHILKQSLHFKTTRTTEHIYSR